MVARSKKGTALLWKLRSECISKLILAFLLDLCRQSLKGAAALAYFEKLWVVDNIWHLVSY
jgi:hypothetical protein